MSGINLVYIITVLRIPAVTALGCVAAYMYSERKGLKTSRHFLTQMFPGYSDTFYFRCDFLLSAIIGTVIARILYVTDTEYQAFVAGLGWTAAFSIAIADRQQSGG